jgi:hypothetical protein
MSMVDLDKDGKVSFEEFHAYITNRIWALAIWYFYYCYAFRMIHLFSYNVEAINYHFVDSVVFFLLKLFEYAKI